MPEPKFRVEVGPTPIFRNLTPASLDVLASAFEPVAVEVGEFVIAEDRQGDVWIVGETTEVVAVTVIEEEGHAWQSASLLRRGDAMGTHNLGGAAFGPATDPLPTRYEISHPGTLWRLPAERIPDVLRHDLTGRSSMIIGGFVPGSTTELVDALQLSETWRRECRTSPVSFQGGRKSRPRSLHTCRGSAMMIESKEINKKYI